MTISPLGLAVLRYGFESVMDMGDGEFEEIFGKPKIDADIELSKFFREASSDQ